MGMADPPFSDRKNSDRSVIQMSDHAGRWTGSEERSGLSSPEGILILAALRPMLVGCSPGL
jgi:hypothetical protein